MPAATGSFRAPRRTTSRPTAAGRPGFVQVTISAQHPSFFGRVFGRTVETVTTSAVAAHTDGNSNSNSLIALDDTDTCATGKISGTGTQISIVPVTDPMEI